MAALTAPRNTQERMPGEVTGLLGASQTVHAGGILMRNASGHLIKGATATGSYGMGRAEESNISSTAGVTPQRCKRGIFRFGNSASDDLITIADIGAACYVVDDQTVAKTSGSSTRSPAGVIADVDAQDVWLRFDEALTRALLS